MFDLEPCVFPLGIFILCTWQWAAGCPLLWAQDGGKEGCAQVGWLWARQGCRYERRQLGGEGQGRENGRGPEHGSSLHPSHVPGPALGTDPSTPTLQPLSLLSLEEPLEVMGRTSCEGRSRKPSRVNAFQEGLKCSLPPACVTIISTESLSDPGHHRLEVSPFWTLRQ